MMVAHDGELFEAAWLERERVLRPPVAIRFGLFHLQALADLQEPKHTCGIGLFFSRLADRFKSKRFEKRLTETDVGEPRFVEIHPQRQMIKLWTLAAVASGDTGGEQSDTESKRAQQGGEGAV